MTKIVSTIFLMVIIVVSFGFIYLKVSAHGSEHNYFNKNLRTSIAQYPLMRSVIGLHYDGDAKYDYLGKEADRIVIEVDSMEGLDVSDGAIERLSDRINKITDKEVSIRYSDMDIPYQQQVDFEELREIKEKYHYHKASEGVVVIYILIASMSNDSENKLGSTLQEDGIVFFQSNFEQMFDVHDQDNYENIISGTLLHEFGHQLGLDHNDNDGCLMNGMNVYDTNLRYADITVDFCEKEIEEMAQISAM